MSDVERAEALKACPLCDAKAEAVGEALYCCVRCTECGCQIGWVLSPYEKAQTVYDAWNTRAALQPPDDQKYRQALKNIHTTAIRKKKTAEGDDQITAWLNVIKFCERAGVGSNIFRTDDITSMQPAALDAERGEALEFINEWDMAFNGVSVPVRKLIPPDIFETIRSSLSVPAWMDISEAGHYKKNGGRILIPDKGGMVVYWESNKNDNQGNKAAWTNGFYDSRYELNYVFYPTKFIPLPPAPSSEEGGT